MARRPSQPAPAGGSISVGGNVTGSALVAGAGHHVVVAAHGAPDAVLMHLQAIRVALDGLQGSGGEAARRNADAALAAAGRPSPDKNLIGGALGRAMEAAQTTEEFGEQVVKLASPLHQAVGWLSDAWSHLTGLLP